MQHFLKSATGAAGAKIIPAQFLEEFLLAMNDAETRA
jgi:hypothetical protein